MPRWVRSFTAAVLLAFFVSASSVQTAELLNSTQSARSLFFGMGLLTYRFGELSEDPTGARSMISAIYPEISLGGRFYLSEHWRLAPRVHYTFPGRSIVDDTATASIIYFSIPFIKDFYTLDLKFGMGLLLYRISGEGGTVELNNGNSTSTFGKPGLSSTSNLFTLEIGVGRLIYEQLRFDMDLFATTPVDASRRSLGMRAGVSYGIF